MEQTLAIIKPDGVGQGLIGEIIRRIEEAGLQIIAVKMIQMDHRQAEGFYYMHKGKPFFDALLTYMTSGRCLVMTLNGQNAIGRWRGMMGNTDPKKADRGTIRRDMGTGIERNVVHGSDSKSSAGYEINYFFKGTEILA